METGAGRRERDRGYADRPKPPARVWRDWVLVGVFVPATLLEGLLRPDVAWRPVALVLGVGLVPTLLWRRTKPLLMATIAFGAGIVASLATTGEPPQLDSMFYLLLFPYSLVRWGEGWAAPVGLAVAVAADIVSFLADPLSLGNAAGGLAVLTTSAALGAAFRFRAGARWREFEQVKLVERERLARDLHDTVAHHVSAIAIRAQAGLATAPTSPDAATDALRLIETEARRTLAEMRTMVRILRRDQPGADPPYPGQPGADRPPSDDPGARQPATDPEGLAILASPRPEDLAPTPGIPDLRRLADDRAGLPVAVRVEGALDDLATPVATALYRLAQEAVTNARRHARGATGIEVEVTAQDREVRLRVRDDGDTSGAWPVPSPGYGLLGMRERVHLLGGTFEAGPDQRSGAAGGWTVRAVLPRSGQPRSGQPRTGQPRSGQPA